ncbi:hypothetical protein HDU76_001430 [Blyttiomyces sp. JEL0837]|nr:hypothetical protein HDU76_001430 [Blyttiomyces sp. JEL0837]
MIRQNSWDANQSKIYNFVDSGGYSFMQAIKLAEMGVTAVVGEYYSKTTLFSGQVFSQLQIPLCGIDQASPTLADKNRYDYFFRMTSGTGFGKYVTTFLKYYNIKRVALVSDFSALGVATTANTVARFAQNGIQVITKIYLSAETVKNHDYNVSYQTLKTVDARFIIIMADGPPTADFYYRARDFGLIGPRYAWLGLNLPQLVTDYPTNVYGPDAADSSSGFIFSFPEALGPFAPTVQAANNTWAKLAATNPRYPPFQTEFGLLFGAYDCTKLIAYGIDKILKDNPTYTPEMLASGSLKPLLNYTAFQNTGYRGVIQDPILLNENGDLLSSQLFFTDPTHHQLTVPSTKI